MKSVYVVPIFAALSVALAQASELGADHRRVIVLDPGHGGSNLGAVGIGGVSEKSFTLPLARAVASRLEQRGFAVILTRDSDRYLTLRERVNVANRANADAFISLHANASPSHGQHGFETWILSADAVDVDSRALRTGGGGERAGVDTATALLLDDLERGAAQWQSAEMAAAVQEELRAVSGLDNDRGVRQESKHVLLGANMPAILVEVGFLDHPVEGRGLLDPAVRDDIALALARAVERSVAGDRSVTLDRSVVAAYASPATNRSVAATRSADPAQIPDVGERIR